MTATHLDHPFDPLACSATYGDSAALPRWTSRPGIHPTEALRPGRMRPGSSRSSRGSRPSTHFRRQR